MFGSQTHIMGGKYPQIPTTITTKMTLATARMLKRLLFPSKNADDTTVLGDTAWRRPPEAAQSEASLLRGTENESHCTHGCCCVETPLQQNEGVWSNLVIWRGSSTLIFLEEVSIWEYAANTTPGSQELVVRHTAWARSKAVRHAHVTRSINREPEIQSPIMPSPQKHIFPSHHNLFHPHRITAVFVSGLVPVSGGQPVATHAVSKFGKVGLEGQLTSRDQSPSKTCFFPAVVEI